MRTLFESLGARVEWDGAQRAVYAWKPDGQGIRLGLGEGVAQQLRMSASPAPGNWGRVVGTQSLDAPAMMIDGRVFVPLRFASEALNADVRYASAEPAVYIRTSAVAGSREDYEPRPRPRPRDDDRDFPRDNDRDRPRDTGRDRPRDIADALDLQIAVPDGVLDRGEPVRFDLVLRNHGDRTLTVPFRSGQRFDFEVLQEGRLVWNWARDRSFTQALTSMTLDPGESTRFSARWNMRDNNGRLVAPGRYLVRGILTTSFQRPQIMAEERIEVR